MIRSIAVLCSFLGLWSLCGCRAGFAPDGHLRAQDVVSPGQGVEHLLVIERADHAAPRPRLAASLSQRDGQGGMLPLPLRQTWIEGDVQLQVGSMRVIQRYHNPHERSIDAVYTFPLPRDAAVSDFEMKIGGRRIRGVVRARKEAEQIYRQARAQGLRVSMMRQDRPRVFTQAVGNIEPGKAIQVEICYFQQLRYDRGTYEMVVPTAAGPRPGSGGQVSVSRRLSSEQLRLRLDIDAGVPILGVTSANYRLRVQRRSKTAVQVELAGDGGQPNEDLVLRYEVARDALRAAVGTCDFAGRQYFALFVQPPRWVEPSPTGLGLELQGASVDGLYPAEIPDLAADRPLLLIGRCKPGQRLTGLRLRGGQASAATLIAPRLDEARRLPALARLWARARIRELHERGVALSQIQATALSHGLVSAYTSFVAVDASGGTGVGRSQRGQK